MKKSILRISKNKENPYVMINRGAIQNEELTWKARGLLAYLLSLPDDWVIYLDELKKHSKKEGKASLASGIKELMEAGYIIREVVRGEKGKFSSWDYTVFESPPSIIQKPDNGGVSIIQFANNGLPNNGKPATTNKDVTNKDLTKKTSKGKYEDFYL